MWCKTLKGTLDDRNSLFQCFCMFAHTFWYLECLSGHKLWNKTTRKFLLLCLFQKKCLKSQKDSAPLSMAQKLIRMIVLYQLMVTVNVCKNKLVQAITYNTFITAFFPLLLKLGKLVTLLRNHEAECYWGAALSLPVGTFWHWSLHP